MRRVETGQCNRSQAASARAIGGQSQIVRAQVNTCQCRQKIPATMARLDSGQTDIPRLREGGVKAQFWSVYIPSEHENRARTVTEQIDLERRMVERYPDAFVMAYSADDVERIARSG